MIAAFLAAWLYLGAHAMIGESMAPSAPSTSVEVTDDGADDWAEFDLSGVDVGEVAP